MIHDHLCTLDIVKQCTPDSRSKNLINNDSGKSRQNSISNVAYIQANYEKVECEYESCHWIKFHSSIHHNGEHMDKCNNYVNRHDENKGHEKFALIFF